MGRHVAETVCQMAYWSWSLWHSNAPAHSGHKSRDCCTLPSVLPYLAWCDCFLLPKFKLILKGKRFDNIIAINITDYTCRCKICSFHKIQVRVFCVAMPCGVLVGPEYGGRLDL